MGAPFLFACVTLRKRYPKTLALINKFCSVRVFPQIGMDAPRGRMMVRELRLTSIL
jgi:hypothetical protein